MTELRVRQDDGEQEPRAASYAVPKHESHEMDAEGQAAATSGAVPKARNGVENQRESRAGREAGFLSMA